MTIPNLFVLGAPKCGTTSLYEFLGLHPHVFVPTKKELHFFTQAQLRGNAAGPGDLDALRSTVQTRQEYEEYFSDAGAARIAVDVSPSYLYYSEVAPEIRALSPEGRLIAILRDPVERTYSQFLHLRRSQREELGFAEALDAERERADAGWGDMWRYTDTSRYTRKLRDYEMAFGRDRMLVVHAEDLASFPRQAMGRIFSFLGLPAIEASFGSARNRTGEARSRTAARILARPNALRSLAHATLPERARSWLALRLVEANTASKEPMPDHCRARLQRLFEPEATELWDYLGEKPRWGWL